MKLVFATNNPNKLLEIKSLVPANIDILSLKDINCFDEIPETYPTLEENALQKANYIYKNYGYDCFSDDTGLEIDVLFGKPGVYSSRYAGENCNSDDNIDKVLNKLLLEKNRSACFRTVIALIVSGKKTLFNGICHGSITNKRQGLKGFGYDPIFIPEGFNKTFANMNQMEKGRISHRGKAIKQLIKFLDKN